MDLVRFTLIADTVMGGRSSGTLTRETVQGKEAMRLRGQVSLENNGGFIQMAADVNADGTPADLSACTGVEIEACGNGQTYNVHLRTSDVSRPWQSYRQSFIAGPQWEAHRIPFSDFTPHRIDSPLDTTRLTRIGIIAIGQEMEADVSVASVRFY